MMSKWMMILCVAALTACGSNETKEQPEDGENDTFVADGKSDVNGVEEHGFAGQCVINLANEASEDELDDDVGLFGTSASRMVDERPFVELGEIDDVPFVGFLSFNKMLRYAKANNYCPQIAEEFAPPGEREASEDVLAIIESELNKRYPADNRPMRRDAHPKAHGCVQANVTIDNNALPEDLRVGLFAQNGQEFPAWIRFSNSDINLKHDGEGDARGMAIKLMDVPGEKILDEHKNELTHDFIMINHPIFAVRNALDYVDFSAAAVDGNPIKFLTDFVLSLDPTEIKFRELLIALDIIKIKIANPLHTQYHSMVPYALGDGEAVKYSAIPCTTPSASIPSDPEDFLRQALSETLATQSACFELAVQRQLDAEEMPLEDPTIEWSTRESPFLTVAQIEIPSQTFDTPEQNEFCENLSYNPFHALPAHRPLGGLNRVRKLVYSAISIMRHDANGAERREPTGLSDQF